MTHLIETDRFPIDFISQLAERESWRKEIYRPIYHVHKWWAKRLGSVFRGVILACKLPADARLEDEFYRVHAQVPMTVFDPFMGSGTTVGEAHKLGLVALGRDINPISVESVRVALSQLDLKKLEQAFDELESLVGDKIRSLYRSVDESGEPIDVLYYFWSMLADCPACSETIPLRHTCIFAKNAYPKRRPEAHGVCPGCGSIFQCRYDAESHTCESCELTFNPQKGPVARRGGRVACPSCDHKFRIVDALDGNRPDYGLFAKLVLKQDGTSKQYTSPNEYDHQLLERASAELAQGLEGGHLWIPELSLAAGHNTKQAIRYGFSRWSDFFTARQLLALSVLQNGIAELEDRETAKALALLFSGVLEFSNLFASYKGEGTGAVRHMFAHHILKPERSPIEANLWGTRKSSGSFSNLFKHRLLRAANYQKAPTEVPPKKSSKIKPVSSLPFSGVVSPWPEKDAPFLQRGVYLSCGDSSDTGLSDQSIDLVVTDPPFFNNVNYSELADFFYAWNRSGMGTTRSINEVQDQDVSNFTRKLSGVFQECQRVLVNHGLLVFSYHHSRDDGWSSVLRAVLEAGFIVVNAHPVKAEMSVATPKSQAKEPIQLDTILVCRKRSKSEQPASRREALASAMAKAERLRNAGFRLSRNDIKVIFVGQLLTTMHEASDFDSKLVESFVSGDIE